MLLIESLPLAAGAGPPSVYLAVNAPVFSSSSFIYGVVSFAVNRRTKEMGIRVALGATRRDIIRLVLSSGTKPIAAGVCGGVAGAMLASQALAQIFRSTPIRLDPRDPVAYAVVTIVLVATSIAAMFGPALRAASADPAHALRQD